MSWISIALSISLIAISALHALWALGSSWPLKNDQDLVRAVVGAENKITMPAQWQSAVVAILLLGASAWPHLMEQTVVLPYLPSVITSAVISAVISIGGWALILVFLGRGLIGLTPWFRRLLPMEPFVSNNRLYYSPLCIAIGSGFLALQIG